MKHWKTTLCGVLAFLAAVAHAYPPAAPIADAAKDLLIALGLYHAADKS